MDGAVTALNERFGLAGQVEFEVGAGGLVFVVITNRFGTARICLQGGQVVEYGRAGETGLIFVSEHAIYAPGKAIRGGIPVCWPWFGPHPTDPSKPQHGFARSAQWDVLATTAVEDGSTVVQLGLSDSPATLPLWPHRFALTLTVQVGPALYVALETENRDEQAVEITEALHSYFRIGDVHSVMVEGLDGVTYVDKVAGGQREVQHGAIRIGGETDRVYENTGATCVVNDPALGRNISVAKEGSQSTVVWNPWAEKAGQLSDLGADQYTPMVCVEVANALDNAVTVAAGERHKMSLLISAESN